MHLANVTQNMGKQCNRYTGKRVRIMSKRTFAYTLRQAVAIVCWWRMWTDC